MSENIGQTQDVTMICFERSPVLEYCPDILKEYAVPCILSNIGYTLANQSFHILLHLLNTPCVCRSHRHSISTRLKTNKHSVSSLSESFYLITAHAGVNGSKSLLLAALVISAAAIRILYSLCVSCHLHIH